MFRLIVVLSLMCSYCLGQRATVSGYVRDQQTGENLIGATVTTHSGTAGTTANSRGFFSLTLDQDSVHLISSYVGYQPIVAHFLLNQDTSVVFRLKPQVLDEVVITPSFELISEESMQGTLAISSSTIKSLPFMLGEVDLMKALQLLPGIHSGEENSTGLYVRGGGPDQNLILLDGATIYNASHLFGFFSIFNPDAINHIELTKGGFPARYGGRLSSVVDINMKNGSMQEIKGEGSIGLLSAKLTMEGPIIKDKTSFIISARRTYFDLLARPFIPDSRPDIGYFFNDFNVKLNHVISGRDRVYLSTYFGVDKGHSGESGTYSDDLTLIDFSSNFGLEWGNLVSAIRWDHVFGPRLFGNASGTFSTYHFNVSQSYEEKRTSAGANPETTSFGSIYESGIRDWNAKVDFDYIPNPTHTIRFGSTAIQHKFSPGVSYYHSTEWDSTAGASVKEAFESATYIEDDWKISARWKLNAGVHFSSFHVDDTWYHSTQPRISTRFAFIRGFAITAAVSRMAQYIHLLTNAGVGLPTDLWVPSTGRVMPQRSNQLALGATKTSTSGLKLSIEGYYKRMNNLIEYKDGFSYLNTDTDWQDKVATNGTGQSYGAEFLVNKTKGAYTGLLGYTISKSTRQFADLNMGKSFPYKYDRRHDLSFALNREFKKRIDVSATWVFGSGSAITLPVAVFPLSNELQTNLLSPQVGTYFGERNSQRLKSYHKLDLSISLKKKKRWGERRWTIAVYNAYNRLNPFFVALQTNSSKMKYELVQYSLFPIIPSVSYAFKF